jgi:uncharacterized protein (DUF433 family)
MAAPVDIGTLIVKTPGHAGGKPRIKGTGITVTSVGLLTEGGATASQIISQHYPQLTLAQVHAALAYFHANRSEIDAILDAEDLAYQKGLAEQAPVRRSS